MAFDILSFRTWLATYKDAMRNERHKHDGMHDRVEGNRALAIGEVTAPTPRTHAA